jgi:hypothetical protein
MPFDQYHRRLQSTPDDIDPYAYARETMVLEWGTIIHKTIQALVSELAKDDKYGVEILAIETPDAPEATRVSWPEMEVTGHFDIYIKFLSTGLTVLYDIKTINERAYTRMKAEGGGVIKPYDHHVKQLLCYDFLLGVDPSWSASRKALTRPDELRLLYVDRNNCRREEIVVERNEEILAEVKAEFEMLQDCWSRKIAPPPPALDSWQYKYSNYKNQVLV